MHRSTTSAALLLTVAATAAAVSGCVSVRQPEPPAASSGPSAVPAAPRPDGRAKPQVVQAPVREALDRMGRTPPPHSPSPEPTRPPRPPQPPRQEAPHRPGPDRAARPAAPPPRHPHTAAPAAPGVPGDVCALGNQYGKWNPDSPEARICRETYGG
ncbi:hypothetical protein ACGF0K_20890 [Streptomyces sp. NPDC048156]|uniref:hypothetical protein n=1 Tax=Streptomyces sp. NPDC048156 TaxID=3365502 RepID=UPI003718CF22